MPRVPSLLRRIMPSRLQPFRPNGLPPPPRFNRTQSRFLEVWIPCKALFSFELPSLLVRCS